jgi:hypothetical protein
MDKLYDSLIAMQKVAISTHNIDKIKLDVIQETHKLLSSFTQQAISQVKFIEDSSKQNAILTDALDEISKYSEQEIQKYLHNSAVSLGKAQGVSEIISLLDNDDNDTLLD